MLSSVLSLVTVCAVVLVVPVFAGLLGMERRRHLAVTEDRGRRVRLVLAATVVGIASLGLAAVLGADPVSATAVAVLMTGAVLAWAPLTGSWAVRGVVVWALLVAATVGLLAWLVERMVDSSLSAVGLAVSGTAWVLLLVSLARVQRYARDLITSQAGLVVRPFRHKRISLLRPVVSLVVLFAAGGVAVATTHGSPARGRAPEAGAPGAPGSYAVPPAAPSLTRGVGAPSTVGIDLAAAIWRHAEPRSGSRLRAATPVVGLTSPAPTSAVVPSPVGAAGASGPATAAPGAAQRVPGGQASAGGGATGGSGPQATDGVRPSAGVRPPSTDKPAASIRPATDDEPTAEATSAATSTRTSPVRSSDASAEPDPAEARKTPGYDEIPDRPSTPPTSGPGQPGSTPGSEPSGSPVSQPSDQPSDRPSDRASDRPSDRASDQPSTQPSGPPSAQQPDSPSIQPSEPQSSRPSDPNPSDSSAPESADPPGQADRTPGYEKAKPSRPADARAVLRRPGVS